ncbi:hypothetical protein JOQ06_015981, partial [Pogonophryne albipinna]
MELEQQKEFQFHRTSSSLKYHLNAKHAFVGASTSSATLGLRQTTLNERSGFVGALAKCRKMVGHFKHSPANTAELQVEQGALGQKEEPLIQDVPTRWNSTLEMVKRLIRNQAAIKATLDQQQHKLVMLTPPEWDKIQRLETLLEPCRYLTEILGGEAIRLLLCVSDEDPAYVVRFKAKFKEDLASRQEHTNNAWLKIATALDPRFKDLKSLPKTDREAVWTTLGGMLRSPPRRSAHTEGGPPKKKINILLQMGTDSESEEEVQPDRAIHRYRAEPTTSMEDCPLQWWSSHAGAHDKLAPLARKYLATPASTVPCERLFSVAGHIVQKKRISSRASALVIRVERKRAASKVRVVKHREKVYSNPELLEEYRRKERE